MQQQQRYLHELHGATTQTHALLQSMLSATQRLPLGSGPVIDESVSSDVPPRVVAIELVVPDRAVAPMSARPGGADGGKGADGSSAFLFKPRAFDASPSSQSSSGNSPSSKPARG